MNTKVSSFKLLQTKNYSIYDLVQGKRELSSQQIDSLFLLLKTYSIELLNQLALDTVSGKDILEIIMQIKNEIEDADKILIDKIFGHNNSEKEEFIKAVEKSGLSIRQFIAEQLWHPENEFYAPLERYTYDN